ncbi:MAG TPA: ArdC-like ssDNA-binding domain-containing protein [Fimbriimonadaceae bacterium]|nr:ArdC-like ssDNA-binding domain-containing protein [Fimbriimonadaceae bacterium]
MIKSQVKTIAANALDQLTSALKAGQSDTLKDYLQAMARFHRYSWFNSVLIYCQRPTAQHVAGFATWKRFNRSVKKGEKGIAILVPIKCIARRSEPDPEEFDRNVIGFTQGYVFDVEQTEGQPLPAFATIQGDPGSYTAKLRGFIAQQGISLEYVEGLGGAKGASSGGRIRILQNLQPAEEFQTLAHELAHELLHKGARRAETDLSVRELEAEAVAFVVSTGLCLDTNTSSADYIKLYNGDDQMLTRSLSHIQNAASSILVNLLGGGGEK